MPGRIDTTDETMPPALLQGETDEERQRRRRLAYAESGSSGPQVSPELAQSALSSLRPETAPGSTPTDDFGRRGMEAARTAATARLAAPQSRTAADTPTMPPAPIAEATPRSAVFPASPAMPPMPLTGRARDLAVGATSQPVMPAAPVGPQQPLEEQAPQLSSQMMPPMPITGANAPPLKPAPLAAQDVAQTIPPYKAGPSEKREQELREQGRPGSPEGPNLSWWKRVLDTISQVSPLGRLIDQNIPGSPANFDWELARATAGASQERGEAKGRQELETARAQAQFNTPAKREAYMQQHPEQFEDMSDFEKNDWRVTGKFPTREPVARTERPENLDREAYDYYVSQGMTPADARKRVLQDAQSVKPERQTHTSAFEAFAYGSPEEKKAAQDYIDLERKVGARYRTPSEFDERYRLFREDPETYKAMFGDKSGAGPDRATATKMLNYFDKRRREIQNDFMLDDQQKAEQLQDVANLEKPFLDVVQPGTGPSAGDGPKGHRVTVIAPDGTRGTVPLSQLGAAKKKGYRVAE